MKKRKKPHQAGRALQAAWDRAHAVSHQAKVSVFELADSKRSADRLYGLCLARRRIEEGESPDRYLEMASGLVEDPDNNCRWQAAIIVGESIESDPGAVWNVVERFGDSVDEDMRAAIATILLEHLLEHDFDTYLNKLKFEVDKGRHRFLDTLELCEYNLDDGDARRVKNYLRRARRGVPGDGVE